MPRRASLLKSAPAVALVCTLVGPATADELHVPAQYPTIQAAIDAAVNGDDIIVAPGTYAQALRLFGKQLTLRSSGGSAVTTLTGASLSTSILMARDGETFATVIEGFTFANGRGSAGAVAPNCRSTTAKSGGAIYIGTASSLTLRDCRFYRNGYNNRVIDGGAIFVYRGALKVEGCVFEENGRYISDPAMGTGYGGCLSVCGGSAGGIEVTDSMFIDNYGAHGGALLLGGTTGPVVVARSTFIGNDAGHGGGVNVGGSSAASVLVADCTFVGNDASHGGGLNLDSDVPAVVVSNCTFTDNESSHGGGAVVRSNGGQFVIEDCAFSGNQAAFGGGLNLSAVNTASGVESVATVRRCTFNGNLAGFGGGLFALSMLDSGLSSPPPLIEVADSVFDANTAGVCCNTGVFGWPCWTEGPSFGGGVDARVQGGRASLTNCLFANNTSPRGAALSASTCGEPGFGVYGGDVSIVNCTMARSVNSGVDFRVGRSGTIELLNSIVRGSAGAQVFTAMQNPVPGEASITISHSNVEGGFGGTGNIDSDPGFVDGAGGDFRLAPGAGAIDAGDNGAVPPGVTTDLDGASRFADDPGTPDTGSGAPPTVDMGAYEFQGTSCLADFNGDGFVDGIDSDSFNNAFETGDASADVNRDGFVDGIDYDTFSNAFESGC